MNKIFKVIWSKSKQCYIVVSEMAKNTTGKKKIIVGAILAGLATQGCNVMAAGAGTPATTNNVWGKTTPGGVAIGQDSVASGASAVDPATGVARVAPSIAIGLASTSAGLDTITIGIGAGNSRSYGISMGKQTNVTGDYGIAIGYQTSVTSDHAVAIGEQTRAPKMGATVMGVSARGYGQGSVSLGWQALAGADVYGSGINIGTDPYKDTTSTINSYQKWGDTAIGLRAVATGGNATALGRSARAAAENAIAIGGGNGNNFNNNTEKTEATAEKAVAVGYNAKATAGDTLALGTSSKASGSDALAIGKNANASNSDSIAIGQDTVSNNINSVALGKTSKATGASATALGPQAKATGSTAVAIGLNSEANQSATVAVGYNSAASGENAAAYGNTAKAGEKNSLALGANTQATVEGGVALGAGSIANTVAGVGYNPNTGRTNTFTGLSGNALTSTWAAVSIGDGTNTRQLTGLAAGTNNTDAVNVAQLKSMNLAFTADGSTKGDVNLTNSALNVVGDSTYITTKGNNQTLTISGKKQTITVTNGTASASAGMADANNVAQAINQANAGQTISYKANGGTANTVKVSDGLNFTNGTTTVATVGTNGQVSYDLNTTTKQSITDSSTAVNRTIALGGSTGSTTAKKLASGDVKFNIKGQTGTNALITTSASGDDVTIAPTNKLTAAVTAAENAADKNLSNISTSGKTVIKDLAKGAAQDAVKVAGTGLATVSDNTTGGVKTYTVDVNTGNLVITANGQVGAAGTTGSSGATGSNGVATTQNVATAINDAVTKAKASTTQALADAEHKFDGDTGATSVRKHGEVLSIKGGVTTPADLSTGNIGVVSDGAGTLNIRLAKVLSGLTSATFTTASGNTTVINGDGVTITPSGTGASAISMTTDGINAGGTEIKNIADGTAATSAVSKGQMETAIANAQTAATSTEKVVAKTLSGDTNLATVTGQTGTAKGETYEVAVSENAVKNVAKAAVQDAVTVTGTGLATVSDNTTGGVKTYTVDVNTGNLVVAANGQVGAAGATGASGAAGSNGVATTQNVATAINDAVTKANANNAQALADAKHNFAGDDATVISRKHGEQLNIKGGASTTATDLTSGNIAVVGDTTTGTLNIKMAKALTGLTSATFTDGSGNTQTVTGGSSTITDGAGHTTAMTKGGLSTTDGTNTTTVAPAGITATDGTNTVKLNGSGIDAGNTQIKNVGKATTDDAAVNKKQMDDAVKSATDATTALGNNTIALGGDTGSTTAKKLSTNAITFNIKGDTGANALITTSATGDNVTIAPTAKLTAAVTAAENSADKDLSNISSAGKTVIKDLAATSAQDAVNVTGTGLATVSDNTTGGVKTYTVNVDEGKLVLDDTTGQIGANGATQGTTAGKNGVATTQNVATAINDAVTKAKASTTQALADAEHKFDGDTGATSVRKHGEVLSIKGGVTTPADLSTGNIGVVSDGAGTLNIRLAKVLSGLTSATFTTASGNTTVINGDGVTITPSGTGASAISMTTDGINAGGTEIKNIADGTAATSAVSKGQMETAIANAQTAATSTEKVIAKALTGDTNLATVTGQTGTAKGETYEVAVSENAVKNVAKAAAQDAVTVTGTGLATVSDNTTGGVKTYTVNVDEGKLVLDDTTGQIGANGATQGTTAGKNGVATTQNVATAINDAVTKAKASTTQALADAEHKFDGDTGATSVRKHGEVLSIKGGVTTPADLSTGNIGVVSDGAGTLNIRLAKVLSGLTSATFTDGSGNTQTVTGASSTITDGAGNTTAMTKGGLSTTDGTNTTTVAPAGVTATDGTNTVKLNGSGIDAGNTQIKNVGKATTDDAAVNKKQMDDAVKSATDATTALGNNTIALGGDTGSTTAKKLSTNAITFNIKGDTGANALITTSATGDDVTIAPTAKLTAAVTAAENSADKDLSNISSAGKTVIKDLAVTSAQDAVNVTGTGLATVSDNTTGGVKTYTVDVKAGNLVVDANGQAGAAGATGTGGAVGTDGVATTQNVATAINDAITKSNANTAQALADAEHKFDGDTGSTSVRKHGEVLSIKGGVANAADLTTGNIGVVSDGAGTLNIRLAKVLNGLTSATFKDASGNTTMVTGGSTTIADTSGNTQTLAPTKSEIKDTNGVSTVTTKDGVTARDASGQTTSLTKGGVDATDGNGNTTSLTNTGVSTTDGHGHTTGLTNGGLSTTDGTNTTTVAPTGITATDGTNTVKLNGSGIDAGNTEIKNVGKATTDDAAVNKKQMDDAITKATADATHEFGGDDATVVSRKHGEKLTIKGGASTNAADLTSGNIAVIGDTNGTLNLKLAKVLTGLTSATFTDGNGNTQTVTGGSSTISDAAGNSTVVSKGGVTTTDAAGNSTTTAPTGVTVTPAGGTQISITTDGINAGGKEVKGIANGTTNDAAVNKGQMDAAVQNALDGTQALGNNTITLGGDTGSTDAKKLNTSGGIQFNIKGESGANALIRTTASGNTVFIASTDKLNNAVAAAENAANKDLSNLSANGESRIKDLAKSAASWNVQTNGGATTAVSGGDTVNFVDGKNITITNTGRAITVATKDDVTFNKITVGGMTLDNNGMDAGNKEIKNVAAGTTANSAVNKQQLDNAISGVSNINYTTSSTTDRAGSTPVHSVSLSTGFNFKGDGNIQVTQDAANNGVIHYAMNPNLSGITSITGAGNGAPTMTFNSQNGNTPANVSINSNLDMGGHRITGVGPAEKPTDAVNKQQVDQALRGLTGMADNAARQYASKAGANAAALAALKPIQYDPLEPTQIMAGVGNYKSQTAVALGMAHYTNENTMFNIGVSLDSHDNMVNAGVTHKFGYSPEKKAIPDRYKGGPISSIYVMQDEMQALLAKDQEKDAVISKQASEIDTLRQQNEDMQRKIDMILAKLQ